MTSKDIVSKLSFLHGMASTLDIGSKLCQYDFAEDGLAQDKKALASDWNVVGQELRRAMMAYE